jgi:hypothetical protein
LFINTDVLFITFHLNDMIERLGRKIMAGDVFEVPHQRDDTLLDPNAPAINKWYVVQDASKAAEGYSQTWWPHLWRVKAAPLTDAQEYKDILNNIAAGPGTTRPVGDILSTLSLYQNINSAVVTQAEADVPKSGYDTSKLYTLPTTEDGQDPLPDPTTSDTTAITADNNKAAADSGVGSPIAKIESYLSGDGRAPNGLPTGAGIAFPANPKTGDYFLRLDYLPNRLFRFTGNYWAKIEDAVRTNITPGTDNSTQRGSFVNNTNTYVDNSGNMHNERQMLSKILTPKADN